VQGFPTGERGSTRLGLILAGVVLLALAAVAVPMVFGNVHNAQDTKARSALRQLASDVEACRLGAETYQDCDQRRELTGTPAVHWGRGPGQAGLVVADSGERSFTAYAVSASGSHLYVWAGDGSHATRRSCNHGSVARLEREGCRGPSW
jgi:type II secretory pathway pseudopilin PulG